MTPGTDRHLPQRVVAPKRSFAALAAAALLLGACASVPEPREQMAVGARAVEAAGTTVAGVPNASADLAAARDKMARAQRALADKRYDEARRLAEQAEVDARLAQARAGAYRGETALTELDNSLRQLREEIARNTPVRP